MIVGFSHLAIGLEWNGGFFTFKDVPSSAHKWVLTAKRPERHDLVVNFPSIMPIELIRYDTGFVPGRSKIRVLKNGVIGVTTRTYHEEKKFFSKIGGEIDGDIHVHSPIGRCNLTVKVIPDPLSPIDPPLDIAGYQALAFYSSSIDNDRAMLIDAGGRQATAVWPISIGGRDMSVCMMRSAGGVPIELVQVLK